MLGNCKEMMACAGQRRYVCGTAHVFRNMQVGLWQEIRPAQFIKRWRCFLHTARMIAGAQASHPKNVLAVFFRHKVEMRLSAKNRIHELPVDAKSKGKTLDP